MELDNIKQRTTWNDASASINSNFMKVRQAILALQSGGGGLDEAELEEYLTSQGYTKEEWVLAQNALLEERIENLEQEGGAVNVEGSAFISVSQDGVISLDVDAQGGLGRTEQGLGIVDIPSHLLEGIEIEVDSSMSDTSENAVQNKVIKKYVDERAEQAYEQANEYTDEEVAHLEGVLNARIDSLEGSNVYNVYYTENNELSEEQLEANKKAYAALMSEEKAAFYLVQEGNVYSRLIVSTTMKSASTEAIAVEAHVILPVGNKTMLGTTAINLYSDGHISMTVVQSNLPTEDEVNAALEQKQDILVDGQNIKTINGESILGEGDIEIQGGNGGGAEVRTLFVNDAGLTSDELSYNAETVQLIFAQHPMIFFASAEEGTPLSEYELMGMDNGRMVFAKYELNEYSTGATYIYLAMDGSTEVGGFSNSELDGDKYDKYLDADSANAVQNKVVTENIKALEATMPLMAVIDLDTIIAQDTPIDNATRNALLELGGYTSGDKYFSKGWIWSRGYLYTIKVIPTDAGVQIHVLSLKGWCEILEDNSKVNHLPSQGGGNVEVDAELSETSENAVSNKAVTMALAETEEVTAAALNELNKRFEEYATKEELEDALANVSGSSNVEVDSELSESSTNAIANKAVTEAIVEDEEVISVALNQMNTRFDDYAPLDALATEIQNAKDVIDASIIDNEEVAAAALVDLDKRLKDITKILSNAGLIVNR